MALKELEKGLQGELKGVASSLSYRYTYFHSEKIKKILELVSSKCGEFDEDFQYEINKILGKKEEAKELIYKYGRKLWPLYLEEIKKSDSLEEVLKLYDQVNNIYTKNSHLNESLYVGYNSYIIYLLDRIFRKIGIYSGIESWNNSIKGYKKSNEYKKNKDILSLRYGFLNATIIDLGCGEYAKKIENISNFLGAKQYIGIDFENITLEKEYKEGIIPVYKYKTNILDFLEDTNHVLKKEKKVIMGSGLELAYKIHDELVKKLDKILQVGDLIVWPLSGNMSIPIPEILPHIKYETRSDTVYGNIVKIISYDSFFRVIINGGIQHKDKSLLIIKNINIPHTLLDEKYYSRRKEEWIKNPYFIPEEKRKELFKQKYEIYKKILEIPFIKKLGGFEVFAVNNQIKLVDILKDDDFFYKLYTFLSLDFAEKIFKISTEKKFSKTYEFLLMLDEASLLDRLTGENIIELLNNFITENNINDIDEILKNFGDFKELNFMIEKNKS